MEGTTNDETKKTGKQPLGIDRERKRGKEKRCELTQIKKGVCKKKVGSGKPGKDTRGKGANPKHGCFTVAP